MADGAGMLTDLWYRIWPFRVYRRFTVLHQGRQRRQVIVAWRVSLFGWRSHGAWYVWSGIYATLRKGMYRWELRR